MGISDDDRDLFRKAVGQINRLPQEKAATEQKPRKPIPEKTLESERAVRDELLAVDPLQSELETGEELSYLRPGRPHTLLRKLRRGKFSVREEMDMHGMTSIEAKAALDDFLKHCCDRNIGCVRIVHGKGHGSRDGKPVLKNKLDHWLRRKDEVIAFCSARPVDGGTGAAYVLLKRR